MNVGLLYICAFTGLVIAFGSLLLIWKGRVLVDSAKGEISEVELPGGFKLKTQQPILVMFLLGSFLLALPIYMVKDRLNVIPKVAISGQVQNKVTGVDKLTAYAIIANSDVADEVKFYLPQLENTPYLVMYIDNKTYEPVFDQLVDLQQAAGGTFNLRPFNVTNRPRRNVVTTAPPVDPAYIVRENPSVVGNFK